MSNTPNDSMIREQYLYKVLHRGIVPMVELKFGSSAGVIVLASDPGLDTVRRGDRIRFSAPLENPPEVNPTSTIRAILQVYRWEPVWTLMDTERRQAWNRNAR